MSLRTKGIYDPPARSDGRRILVTRYWPRGVSRHEVDEYVSALAPSRELLRAIKDGAITWRQFAPQYRREMRADVPRGEIGRLAATAASRTVTLMCTCREDARCHRSLLRKLVEAKIRRPEKLKGREKTK